MMTPQPNPRGMSAMGANRASEHNAKQVATLMEATRDIANRVLELTEQVATLMQRVEDLEARE